eukprot:TRINITY_DN2899_c0_g1_i2.p1 TRINITY_DN2899_c0_g1~~TRINITY_DN2899_c0_g1_i2.p1  ORF type:complete len:509 (+),score=70.27 TRINITY_DN2899_c0_g1_i2:390-1916(+)
MPRWSRSSGRREPELTGGAGINAANHVASSSGWASRMWATISSFRYFYETLFGVGVSASLISFAVWVCAQRMRDRRTELDTVETIKSNVKSVRYDVCVVGAGPSGATCAYYLAKSGKNVLLLEKAKFPRDKVCGDALSPQVQAHLDEMGVLQDILSSGQGRWVRNGGVVTPTGKSFIGEFTEAHVLTVQRVVLDQQIAAAAVSAGALLVEEMEATNLEFHPKSRSWSITCKDQSVDGESSVSFEATVVVAADGAVSKLARSIGVVTSAPNTVCSRSFVKAGSHTFRADNVLFYSEPLLPGYFVINHEQEDYLNLCCFVIPGGDVGPDDLYRMYQDHTKKETVISRALGPEAELSPFQSAPLRLGGVDRSFTHHFVVVGDAAGHVDPLTCEGIQYGMEAAKLAAATIVEGFACNDLSAERLNRYHKKWTKAFGWDFYVTMKVAQLFYRWPVVLDAAVDVIRNGGEEFIASWALVRTGAKSKLWYLRPDVGAAIVFIALFRWLRRRLARA